MSVCVVSLDSFCRGQVHVSLYCAMRIPAHCRCTQCSIWVAPSRYLLPTVYLSVADITYPEEEIMRPTEGACWMAVPAMSTRPRTNCSRMPSTHPAIRNANHMVEIP